MYNSKSNTRKACERHPAKDAPNVSFHTTRKYRITMEWFDPSVGLCYGNFRVRGRFLGGEKHSARGFCNSRRQAWGDLPADGLGGASRPAHPAFPFPLFLGDNPSEISLVRNTGAAHETLHATVSHGPWLAGSEYPSRGFKRITIRECLRCGLPGTGSTTSGLKSASGEIKESARRTSGNATCVGG